MKKLKINLVAIIINLIGAMLYLFSLFMVDNYSKTLGVSNDKELLLNIFLVFAILAIVINLISFFQSKKVKIKIIGQLLGLIGHTFYLICGIYLAWISMIFSFLASFLIFKNNNYKDLNTLKKYKKEID